MCMRALRFFVGGCCVPPSFPRYPPRKAHCAFSQGIFCDRGGGSVGSLSKKQCFLVRLGWGVPRSEHYGIVTGRITAFGTDA